MALLASNSHHILKFKLQRNVTYDPLLDGAEPKTLLLELPPALAKATQTHRAAGHEKPAISH